jgi:hypothetical protein
VNKILLTTVLALAISTCYAQKKQDPKRADQTPKELAAPVQLTPIAIISTDPAAKEDKLDNSWTFTNAKILLHGTDTLSCDVMICRPDIWLFKSNVRITSPDGLVVRANELAINAVPKN